MMFPLYQHCSKISVYLTIFRADQLFNISNENIFELFKINHVLFQTRLTSLLKFSKIKKKMSLFVFRMCNKNTESIIKL